MIQTYGVSTMQICHYSNYPEWLSERRFKARSLAYIPHAIDRMNEWVNRMNG